MIVKKYTQKRKKIQKKNKTNRRTSKRINNKRRTNKRRTNKRTSKRRNRRKLNTNAYTDDMIKSQLDLLNQYSKKISSHLEELDDQSRFNELGPGLRDKLSSMIQSKSDIQLLDRNIYQARITYSIYDNLVEELYSYLVRRIWSMYNIKDSFSHFLPEPQNDLANREDKPLKKFYHIIKNKYNSNLYNKRQMIKFIKKEIEEMIDNINYGLEDLGLDDDDL